jgi:hypothetical protein
MILFLFIILLLFWCNLVLQSEKKYYSDNYEVFEEEDKPLKFKDTIKFYQEGKRK